MRERKKRDKKHTKYRDWSQKNFNEKTNRRGSSDDDYKRVNGKSKRWQKSGTKNVHNEDFAPEMSELKKDTKFSFIYLTGCA